MQMRNEGEKRNEKDYKKALTIRLFEDHGSRLSTMAEVVSKAHGEDISRNRLLRELVDKALITPIEFLFCRLEDRGSHLNVMADVHSFTKDDTRPLKKVSVRLFADQWPNLNQLAIDLSAKYRVAISRDAVIREIIENALKEGGF
jgi:hypothetical protein